MTTAVSGRAIAGRRVYAAFTAESVWTRWLSTQVSLAYAAQNHPLSRAGVALYAPDATANPLRVWSMGPPAILRPSIRTGSGRKRFASPLG